MLAKPQAAALPVHDGRVCLVTSRNRRRWVIPKGGVDRGHTPSQAAAAEAWEEAGLIGRLSPVPVGEYLYTKSGQVHRVTVFLLFVTEEKPTWPERAVRTRVWLSPAEAAERVEEPDLRAIIRQFDPTASADPSPDALAALSD